MSSYEIFSRPEVEADLRCLSKGEQTRILVAIRKRLTTAPELYGKPLGGSLKGLRRVRVGDYRIAYQVKDQEVILWAIIHRKDIYPQLEKRYQK